MSPKRPNADDFLTIGRKIRVTKVPFSASARALIDGDARGFIKLVSDPMTGVVLGGSIVGRHAAELISVKTASAISAASPASASMPRWPSSLARA